MKKNYDLLVLLHPTLKKLIMELKIAALIILVSVTNIFASVTYSQSAKVTLDMENKTLEQVMDEIERQSEFYFIFNQKQIDVDRVVSIEVDGKLIGDILPDLFAGTNVNYAVLDRKILLTTETLESGLTPAGDQQETRVSGTVTDSETGDAMPGVNVLVKGTTLGTLTDLNGKYTIGVPDRNAVLIFSFIGYSTIELPVAGKTVLDAALKPELTALEEVVVIGYGTVKKATVTGSISTVSGKNLQYSPAINFTNTLTGRLSGITAVQRSGEPGLDGTTITIRGVNTLGNNSPLVVIDGIANRSMSGLSSPDIESITVLKDASAAIYGAQAANGVILITTKRGTAGKMLVDVTVNQGWNTPTIIPAMSDAATYATMLNETDVYKGRTPRYSESDIQLYKDGTDPWGHPNTDWYAETFKKFSQQRNATVSASGGSDILKYFVSVGSDFQDAIYKNSATNYKQANFRSNIDAKISDNVRLSFDIAGRQENRNYPTRASGEIFSFLIKGKPILPAYWPNGLPGPDIEYGDNPVVIVTDQTGYDKDKRYYAESNIKLDITIPWVKGLSVTGNASIDKYFRDRKLWQKPWYLYFWDYKTYDDDGVPVTTKSSEKGFSEPRLTQYMENSQTVTLNALINYEKTINEKHSLRALVGTESLKGQFSNFNAYRRYFLSTEIDQLFAGGDLEKTNDGSASETARLNYFGRLNYNYDQKYLVEFVFRYDGSYIFPEDKRFGFFPGVSLGWTASNENFWKNSLSFINFFKLRGSWGQTGNDRIDPYQYLSSYRFRSQTYIFNGTVENKMLNEQRIPNPVVTWEVANQSNIGFDGQLFDGRINFSADYFYNLRTNILWTRNASVPASTGLTLPRENIGKVANQGFELLLGTNNAIGDFSYAVSLNTSYNKNKIIFWDETPGVPDYQKSTGHPMNSALKYVAIGIFRDQEEINNYPHWASAKPGDVIFKDVNKDDKIDGLDQVRRYKTTLPTFSGGLNIDLAYKNFYSVILLQGAAGAEQDHWYECGEWGNWFVEDSEGRWTVDNIDATKPRTWERVDEYWTVSSNNTYWLRSTDFIRLKNVEFGYDMPKTILTKMGLNGLRIYVSGINLLTFDKLPSLDPEVTATNVYPPNKVYNVGINLTF